jgi:hemolysin activation/secretion protein
MRNRSPVFLALFATIPAAQAQQLPSAGTQLQQLPQPTLPTKSAPDLVVERPANPASGDDGSSITLQSLRITGQTLFSEAELRAATGFAPGSMVTFSQLREFARRVSEHYHASGYFLAQAYLPEQGVSNGTITIAVVEGRYGKIDVRNVSRLADRVPTRVLRGLDPGAVVANAPLERRLLLLSDIPGVRVKGTLAPGAAVGTSDLIVDVTPGRLISGSLEADNAGSRYTGAYRFGGTVNVNNPAGIGDQLSLRLLASDSGLGYGRVSYQAPVGNLTLGVAYAHLRYDLGREFNALDGSGTADILTAYASYPLVRSRLANLYGLASFDYRMLNDRIGVVSTDSDKHVQAGSLGVAGDFRDKFGGGGSTVFAASWTIGNLDIRSAPVRIADAATARSAGNYNKVQGSVARLQSIAGPLSLYGSVRGQLAFDNLDSSEKMELGGAYGVRAYPEGEAFGDTAYIATAEARLRLNRTTDKVGQFELIGFVETGEVRFAQDPWFTGSNHAVRSGYGAGLNWYGPAGFIVKGSYARKLGTGPATSAPDRGGRFWAQIVKLF